MSGGQEKFVSGLPRPERVAIAASHPGRVLLARLRAQAAAEADALAVLTVARFDGNARIPPDENAVAVHGVFLAMVALCDGIAAAPELLAPVAMLLARQPAARGGGR